MKHRLYIVALTFAILFIGCDDKNKITTPAKILAEDIQVTSQEQQVELEYSIENSIEGEIIQVATNATWVTNLDTSTEGIVRFDVLKNTSDARSAEVNLTYKSAEDLTILLSQQEAGNSLELSTKELSYLPKGGRLTVSVTSDRAWSLSGSSAWLAASKKEGTSGTTEIEFTASENTSDDPREVEFIITSGSSEEKLTINQGFTGRIIVKTPSYTVPYTKNSVSINVETSKELTVSFEEEYAWVREVATKGMEERTFSFEVDENPNYEVRTAIIILSSEDATEQVEIVQEKGLPSNYLNLIPDEKFKAIILKNFDSDGDEILTHEEVLAVTKIVTGVGSKVESYEGMEFFINAEELELSGSLATSITVKNPKVKKLTARTNNALSSLDVAACTEIEEMVVVGNMLKTLDVSKQTKLRVLDLDRTPLNSIDLSSNISLEKLVLVSEGLATLDLSKNIELQDIKLDLDNLTSIDLTKNTKLEFLTLDNSKSLTSLDLSNNVHLLKLSAAYSTIASFDVSKLTKLSELKIRNNLNLISLDVSKNMLLATIDLSNSNNLKDLWMTQGQVISIMTIPGDKDEVIKYKEFIYPEDCTVNILDQNLRKYMLDSFDTDDNNKISEAEALLVTKIDCKNLNIVDFLGLDYFPNITYVDCSDNPIREIEVGLFLKLETLIANNCELSSLTLDRITTLKELSVSNSKLSSISGIRNSKDLEKIVLSNNSLSSTLAINYMTKVKYIDVSNNQLGMVQMHGNAMVEYIDMSNNKIAYTAHQSFLQLKEFYLQNNPFTKLDNITKLTKLEKINASSTEVATIDFSKNILLKEAVATDCTKLTQIYIGSLDKSIFSVDENVTISTGSPK